MMWGSALTITICLVSASVSWAGGSRYGNETPAEAQWLAIPAGTSLWLSGDVVMPVGVWSVGSPGGGQNRTQVQRRGNVGTAGAGKTAPKFNDAEMWGRSFTSVRIRNMKLFRLSVPVRDITGPTKCNWKFDHAQDREFHCLSALALSARRSHATIPVAPIGVTMVALGMSTTCLHRPPLKDTIVSAP